MSIRAMTWAYEQKLPCVHKFLLVTLGEFADRENKCWPSQATLAEVCGLTRQHVNKCLADLARDGLIAVEQRTRQNGASASCCYHILVSSSPTLPVIVADTPVSQDDATPVSQDDGHYVEPSIFEPKEESPPTPPAGGDAGFSIWYAVYPHKVGKAAALKAFKTVRKRTPLEALIQGVHRYVQTKPPDRPWCNPATWLNQQRWLDQPAEQSLPFSSDDDISDEQIEAARLRVLAKLKENPDALFA